MARIQIPLDMLTSRLNLSDRLASVRAQSLASRFSNLKPLSEFFDVKRLSKPQNFGEVQSRVNYNLGYFSSNYAVVFAMLSIYSLLTNLTLLFVIFLIIGGMWAIGKLNGQDLDIAGFRATTSQLYTGLFVIAIPLGFFRGGGLSGRPRSPELAPSWGRPPGAKGSKIRRRWLREQAEYLAQLQRREEEVSRIEELDSEEDSDSQGVGLNFSEKRFISSDSVQFTGRDITKARARKKYAYSSGESSEESLDDDDDDSSTASQIAKDELLAQEAFARIRRAQEKGKREVKLDREQLEALARQKRRMESDAHKSKRGSTSSSSGSDHKHKERQVVPIASLLEGQGGQGNKSRRSYETSASHPASLTPGPPGMFPSSDSHAYPAVGYHHSSRSSPARGSPARSRSSTRHSRTTPPPQIAYQASRLSESTPRAESSSSSRDDESWRPGRSRRSSISHSHANDPFDYQTSGPPIPQGHRRSPSSNRRSVIVPPPDVAYSNVKRNPPHTLAAVYSSTSARLPATPPSVKKSGVSNSSEEDESDELSNGVQVYVKPEREKAIVTPPSSSKKSSSSKKRNKRK